MCDFCCLQAHECNLSPGILPSCSPALFLRQEDRKWTRHITMTANPRNETPKQTAVLLDANHSYEHFTFHASLARINGSVRVLCNPCLIFLVQKALLCLRFNKICLELLSYLNGVRHIINKFENVVCSVCMGKYRPFLYGLVSACTYPL